MVRSKLFWKLFIMYAVLTTGSILTLTVFDLTDRSQLLRSQQDHRLRDVATVLQHELEEEWGHVQQAHWQDRLREMSLRAGMSMSIIDVEGKEWASSRPHDEGASYDLPSDVLARAVDEGGTFGQVLSAARRPMRYCVLPVQHAGRTVGYVRTSELMRNVDSEKLTHQRMSLMMALLVTSIALLGTYIAVSELWRPVAVLTSAANAIAQGRDVAPVAVDRGSELVPLADALNRMNREIRRREREYLGAADLLSTVLGGMAEGVLAVDRSQQLLFANAAAGRFLKFDPQATPSKPIRDVIRHDGLRRVIAERLSDRPVAGEGPTEVRLDGNRVLAVNAARLPGSPCPGLVVVLHDVTQLRGLEEMRQQFVANVSHELKTPLSSIKLHAETLMAGAIDDSSVNRTFLGEIEAQAERLHQLILDMLQLARIESGQQGLDIEPIDVAEVVESSLRYHHGAAERKEITLHAAGAEPGIYVMADHEGIQQILDNLIDNAVKYSPQGKRVEVRWHYDADQVVIEVQDQGPGIKPEDQERVFERFFRVDKARSREIGSTGLGLSIVKHLTRALGGSVKLQSEYGVGSTFSIHLPHGPARVDSVLNESKT